MEKSDRGRRHREGGVAGCEAFAPPIDKVFKLNSLGKACEHMEANKHLGKIVLTR
jgi:hypothetical protein